MCQRAVVVMRVKDRDAKVRYLLQHMDWLDEELGEYEDDYLIIDCPGELCGGLLHRLCLTTSILLRTD